MKTLAFLFVTGMAAAPAALATTDAAAQAEPLAAPSAPPVTQAARPSATTARPSLEAAWKREVALLEAERDALRDARSQLDAGHSQRLQALRREVAALEAQVTAARAKNDGLGAELARLERMGQLDEVALRSAAGALHTSLRSSGVIPDPTSLAGLLDSAVRAVERGARVESHDSAFFDADGTWRDGRVVQVGALAAVAASAGDGPAGALVGHGPDGAGHLVPGSDAEAAARRFVWGAAQGAGAAAQGVLAPLALGAVAQHALALEDEEQTWLDRARAGGPALWIVLLAGVVALAGAAVRVLALGRARGAAQRHIDDVVALVAQGEGGAAAGLCRSLPGPASSLWSSIVEASMNPAPHVVEEELADALPAAFARVERAQPLLVASIAVVLLVGASAAVGTKGMELDALSLALRLAIPLTCAVAAAAMLSRSLKALLERGALQIADAARTARADGP